MNSTNGPPPPRHGPQGQQQARGQNLPPGNYDIFVVPPHSSGSGFLYLPSLHVQRNSFIAGCVCTTVAFTFWSVAAPLFKEWASSLFAGGGPGVLLLFLIIGVIAWAAGKTQAENSGGGPGPGGGAGQQAGSSDNNTSGAGYSYTPGTGPHTSSGPFNTGPQPSWQQNTHSPGGWEKAREEMRKKEEERKKREEADKKAKEAAEKAKWDQARTREREMREKEAREKVTQERLKREKEARDRAERARAGTEKQNPGGNSNYRKPTAASFVSGEDESGHYHSHRHSHKNASQSSFVSDGSYMSGAGSHSTARTTPPPSNRGPYVNKDPDKVTIRGVFLFSDVLPGKPVAQLVKGMGTITDGLVLRMTTEGLFIDDDVRGVPQREWDVKAWTMKLVESGDLRNRHLLRASTRDTENKKYVFVLDDSEAWKVAVGLQRLRKGTQVRSLGVSGFSVNEMTNILRIVGL